MHSAVPAAFPATTALLLDGQHNSWENTNKTVISLAYTLGRVSIPLHPLSFAVVSARAPSLSPSRRHQINHHHHSKKKNNNNRRERGALSVEEGNNRSISIIRRHSSPCGLTFNKLKHTHTHTRTRTHNSRKPSLVCAYLSYRPRLDKILYSTATSNRVSSGTEQLEAEAASISSSRIGGGSRCTGGGGRRSCRRSRRLPSSSSLPSAAATGSSSSPLEWESPPAAPAIQQQQ